jgi:phosphatidylinositol alpha-mannosyltransferase
VSAKARGWGQPGSRGGYAQRLLAHVRRAKPGSGRTTPEGNAPLKIAMASYYLPSESKIGVGYWAHAYANILVERGHDVTMLSPCSRPDGALYRHHHLPMSGSCRSFRWAFALRRIDLSPYDVLHAHGDDYWLWRRRVPAHVRTMHGSCYSEAFHINGLKERVRMLALGMSETLATLVADETHCVSPETRRWSPWVQRVTPPGVDVSAFSPGGEKEPAPTILFVGTYRQRKRGWLLAEVFANQVRPALADAQLWMVCSDAPPADGITVFGRVGHDVLVDLYRRASVFCLPSTYEGFGIPYVESLACGTPVIATSNPGSRYVLGNGEFGALVSDEDLGAALIDLLSDPETRSAMAAVSLARAHAFSLAGVAETYEASYYALISRHNAGDSR